MPFSIVQVAAGRPYTKAKQYVAVTFCCIIAWLCVLCSDLMAVGSGDWITWMEQPVVIDGNFDEWTGQSIFPIGSRSPTAGSISALVRLCWNDQGVAIAADIRDDIVTIARGDQQARDSIEVYLDLRQEGRRGRMPYETGVYRIRCELNDTAPHGVKISSVGPGTPLSENQLGQIRAAYTLRETGWGIEVLVPWFHAVERRTVNLGLALRDSDDARVPGIARVYLGTSNGQTSLESDPRCFERFELTSAGTSGTPGLWWDVAEVVHEGAVALRVECASIAGQMDPIARQRAAVALHSGQTRIELPLSSDVENGVFYSLHYLRVPESFSDDAPIAVELVDVDSKIALYRLELEPVIRRARRAIELEIPESMIATCANDRQMLGRFLKEMALEVTEQMVLVRTSKRQRIRQLRVRDDPTYFSNFIRYYVDLARAAMQDEGRLGASLRRYLHAWRSSTDQSLQVMKVQVPFGYDKNVRYPLEVHFHPLLRPGERFRWLTDLLLMNHKIFPAYSGSAIRLHLFGRGNAFELYGDEEFKYALDWAHNEFAIDSDQVVFSGISDGATWALQYALRYPDEVTHVDIRSGGYMSYLDVEPGHAGRSVVKLLYDPIAQIRRLSDIHVRATAGEYDPSYIRRMFALEDALRLERISSEAYIVPGVGHEFVIPSLAASGELAIADRQRYTLANGMLKHGSNRHVGIYTLESFGAPWLLEVEMSSKAHAKITANNVSAFWCDSHWDKGLVLRSISVNSQTFPVGRGGGRMLFEAQGNTWRVVNEFGRGLAKTPECSGPIFDLRNRPVLIVLGTLNAGSVSAIRYRGYRIAEELDGAEWYQMTGNRSVVKRDVEVTEEDLRRCNLWIVGRNDENSLWKMLGSDFPISVTAEMVKVGDAEFRGRALFANYIYPHPFLPGGYIYYEQSQTSAGYAAPIMPNMQFDYSVRLEDSVTSTDLLMGFWNAGWQPDATLQFRSK